MSLPRAIPAAPLYRIVAALAEAGLTLGPVKPGTRVTRLVEHDGDTWELTYLGPMGWRLTGPGAEHGIGVDEAEAVEHITAVRPVEEAPAADPHPGVPATHLGVTVPLLVRGCWHSPLAEGWRLGVRCTVAAR